MRYTHFTKDERNEISVLLNKGYSVRDIGKALGKNPSSVSREITRNKVKGIYDPKKAHHKAYFRRYRTKWQGMKIKNVPELEEYIKDKLKDDWTPEQIAGRLRFENNDETVISYKSIYNWLDTVWGQDYEKYLPRRAPQRLRRHRKKKKNKQRIKNRVFIDERPDIINHRKRLGDFEGDTLGVPRTSKETLAGLLERQSRYLLGKKIPVHTEAISTFDELLNPHNALSITMDSGSENARHLQLGISTFFCHPYSAWEKGSIENAFKRLRRHVPKKANLTDYSQEEISAIIGKMNNTPRKCLGFRTPKEVFFQEQPLQLKVSNLAECCTSG